MKVKYEITESGTGLIYLFASRQYTIRQNNKNMTIRDSGWSLYKTYGPSRRDQMIEDYNNILKEQQSA